ncbi:hypothetical protein BVJ53_05280 [Lacticaseibacillus chiayiensis]|uniref:TetR/AcrR family transcriptional regulator n=1 Tax=Lacticaseibacillus chiayiensis TaxID=2100821 RepID=A0A4V1P298_9LACO|nr:TetR/AcrR family transcriptional regulator [Lacticaseibacillus chiayiensis]QVI34048.1 TetR/AcrR family transcriptional regulator [Lacticaseibacillus chiayiensis]RXT26770.1 hypothetical protein BVJ53_05280 [Lacticaseibacillus chiayiensis]RXT59129.1 hypothetical protein CHT97_02260 [Lacticaseibacillus chiayiensis]UYN55824.1 TetR/AcrR family transcriptional regulator [Lacticaseibacillus chiayiensis]
MSHQTDLRVIKTNDAIHTAFLSLIDQKGFENITINDIAQTAKINRSTFYLHYVDKYDLLKQMTAVGMTKIIAAMAPELYFSKNTFKEAAFTDDLGQALKVVANEPRLYAFILNDPNHLGLRQQAEDALQQHLIECLPQKTAVERDLLLNIVPAVYLSVIRWWLANDMRYSSTFLAHELAKFFKLGSRSLMSPESHMNV